MATTNVVTQRGNSQQKWSGAVTSAVRRDQLRLKRF